MGREVTVQSEYETRLYSRYVVRGECWEWTRGRHGAGYGQMYYRGKLRYAHILSWTFHNMAPVVSPLEVRHSCHNPPCINPAHLSIGTSSDNTQDMVRAGRNRNGQADKTHCPHGHAYDEENTYVWTNGWRVCRACNKNREAIRRERARSSSGER